MSELGIGVTILISVLLFMAVFIVLLDKVLPIDEEEDDYEDNSCSVSNECRSGMRSYSGK
jgi:hypothetical protein